MRLFFYHIQGEKEKGKQWRHKPEWETQHHQVIRNTNSVVIAVLVSSL